jgi:hypothetical protein
MSACLNSSPNITTSMSFIYVVTPPYSPGHRRRHLYCRQNLITQTFSQFTPTNEPHLFANKIISHVIMSSKCYTFDHKWKYEHRYINEPEDGIFLIRFTADRTLFTSWAELGPTHRVMASLKTSAEKLACIKPPPAFRSHSWTTSPYLVTTVSETLYFCLQLRRLIARKDFISQSFHESFMSYRNLCCVRCPQIHFTYSEIYFSRFSCLLLCTARQLAAETPSAHDRAGGLPPLFVLRYASCSCAQGLMLSLSSQLLFCDRL